MKNPYRQLTAEGLYTDRTLEALNGNPLGIGQVIPSHVEGSLRSELISSYPYSESTSELKKVSNEGIPFIGLFSTFSRLNSTSTIESSPSPKNQQWGKRGYSLNTYYPKQLKNCGVCPCPFLSKFLMHVPESIFIFDNKFTMLFANRLISGHPSQFIGQNILLRIHPDYRDMMKGLLNKAFKTMKPIQAEARNTDGLETVGTIVPLTKELGFSIVSLAHRKVLTAREREILNLVKSGLSSKQISEKLHIAVSSVSTHRKNIGKKI